MLKSFMQPGTTSNTHTGSNRAGHSAYQSSKSSESAKVAEATKAESRQEAPNSTASEDGNKLIVGPNIKLKGSEITDCEILVVEGRVEASMNSRDIRIAEGGVFAGKAEIDVAEVRGTFEGELTARKRLVVYATGRVSGTIRYGALMVEEGGTLTGNLATHSSGSSAAKVTEISAPSASGEAVQEETPGLELAHSASTLARNSMGKRQA